MKVRHNKGRHISHSEYVHTPQLKSSHRLIKVTQGSKKLYLETVRTEFGRKATTFKGVQDWNRPPGHLRNKTNAKTFRPFMKHCP